MKFHLMRTLCRRLMPIAVFLAVGTTASPRTGVKLVPVVDRFNKPVAAVFTQRPAGVFYVVEQTGKIFRIDGKKRSLFLDLSSRISHGYEQGLLSMALPPSYSETGRDVFYINYTTPEPYHTVIAEVSLVTSPVPRGDVSRMRTVMRFGQPYANHNGGLLLFGPDGKLYIGTGDGGSGGDPGNRAQNPKTRLGKILRIDPRVDGAKSYTLPNDNPRIQNGLPEIYAFGLRNPWRFSFDRATGRLYVGDVGQSRREEIDLVEAGDNLGWNVLEGELCYREKRCNPKNYTAPIHTYGRSDGIAVTGGYVYRGKSIPSLVGSYIFADYGSGNVWELPLNEKGRPSGKVRLLLKNAGRISSFGEDVSGELYLIEHGAGVIYRLSKE